MYEPVFNSVLVEVDVKDAKWVQPDNNDEMLGASYSRGKVIRIGDPIETQQYPDINFSDNELKALVGKDIIWNEGAEAGTTFSFDGKQFGFIYWYDIRGAKVDDK